MSGEDGDEDAYTSLYFPQFHQIAVSAIKDVVRHGWLTKQGVKSGKKKKKKKKQPKDLFCVCLICGGVH
jgi:hypothetical protein